MHHVVPTRPTIVDLSVSPTKKDRRSSHRRDSAIDTLNSVERVHIPKSHGRDGRRRHIEGNRQPSMPKPPRLRRDQIVMPTPLAPTAEPTGRTVHPPVEAVPLVISPTSLANPSSGDLTTPLPPPNPRVHALRRQGASRNNTRRHTHGFVQEPQRRTTDRRLSAPIESSTDFEATSPLLDRADPDIERPQPRYPSS